MLLKINTATGHSFYSPLPLTDKVHLNLLHLETSLRQSPDLVFHISISSVSGTITVKENGQIREQKFGRVLFAKR